MMEAYFCDALDWAHSKLSQKYKDIKEEIRVEAETGRMVSLAALSASIACISLGIALSAAGLYPAGIPIVFVFLPIGYLSYNYYVICSNARIVAKNPKHYQPNLGFSEKLDERKLKNCLLRGTYYGEWMCNAMLNFLVKEKKIILHYQEKTDRSIN